MPLFRVQADCPVEEYEADDWIDAIRQYSENYRVNEKYLIWAEINNEETDEEG